MNQSVATIERIGQKMQLLIKHQETLVRDNEKLQRELEQRDKLLQTLQDKMQHLEDQVAVLQAATIDRDDLSKKAFEKRINQYIKDIDKVIAHLQQG